MQVRKMCGVLAVTLPILAFAHSAAAGVYTNNSGAICKNYNASEAGYIDYFTYGTRSLKSTSTTVICPLVRSTVNSNGAFAYIDIYHTSSATTSCTLYSYNYEGSLLGSRTVSGTWSGKAEMTLNLAGSGKSATFSDYSVLCTIPGGGKGIIMGVDLSEQ